MKSKFFLIGILLVLSLALTGCFNRSFSSLKENEYGNFIHAEYGNSSYSPTEYSVILGQNPSNEYSWTEVTVGWYWPAPFIAQIYQGDDAQLLKAYYKEADVIMKYSNYYYIGRKKIPDKE